MKGLIRHMGCTHGSRIYKHCETFKWPCSRLDTSSAIPLPPTKGSCVQVNLHQFPVVKRTFKFADIALPCVAISHLPLCLGIRKRPHHHAGLEHLLPWRRVPVWEPRRGHVSSCTAVHPGQTPLPTEGISSEPQFFDLVTLADKPNFLV